MGCVIPPSSSARAALSLHAGEKGYFRIRRGQNDCKFEEGVLAGMPDV